MPEALKVKQFGLPRWVWLVALAGGVVGGLYIRSRRAEQEASASDEYTADGELNTEASMTDAYNGVDGLPVGFYDAVSGAGDYLPDASGEDTSGPIINITLPDGSTEQKRVPKKKTPAPGSKKRPAKPKKKAKPVMIKPLPVPVTGGGPPKRPKPTRKKPAPGKQKVTIGSKPKPIYYKR